MLSYSSCMWLFTCGVSYVHVHSSSTVGHLQKRGMRALHCSSVIIRLRRGGLGLINSLRTNPRTLSAVSAAAEPALSLIVLAGLHNVISGMQNAHTLHWQENPAL